MQLTCPECKSRYEVADSAVPASGRTVRCANCGHSWLATLPVVKRQLAVDFPAAAKPAPTATINPVASTPAIAETIFPEIFARQHAGKTLKMLTLISMALVICLMPFIYRKSILHSHQELAFLYEPFGIFYIDGLALADLNVTKTLSDNKKLHISVNCFVINETSGSRELPEVIVTLVNGAGVKVAHSANLVEKGKNMVPGAMEPCKTYQFETSDDTVDIAHIDLMDPFDRYLRK